MTPISHAHSTSRPVLNRSTEVAWREADTLILRQCLKLPLVISLPSVGELSDEAYSTARSIAVNTLGSHSVADVYELALCGGEPYGRWL